MTDLPETEELRHLIIETYMMTGLRDPVKYGLRPSEMVKHIINFHVLQLTPDEKLNLNMRLSRLLQVMVDEGTFTKNIVRSKEVYYKIADDISSHYDLYKEAEWGIDLPPIFALYGLIKQKSSYDGFRKDLLEIFQSKIEDQIKDLWEQYILLGKYSFEDWPSNNELIDSDTATPAQKLEAVKVHNLLFQQVIYQKEVFQGKNEHIKWTDIVNIKLPYELYRKLRNHAVELDKTPNEIAGEIIQNALLRSSKEGLNVCARPCA